MITGVPVEDVIIEAYGPIFNGPGAEKAQEPFILRKLETSQLDAIERAKRYAMEQNIKVLLLKQTQQTQNLQMNAARRNQTIALLNRIYIGSIAYDIKEDVIKQAFVPFGPVKNVSMSWDPATQKHKGFAFVEFEYPEAAQLAIEQMNGSNFGGRLLKVGRPSNLPDAAPFMAELINDYKLQNRIYVAGVHSELTDSDIECVFQAFGNITMCRLIQDPHHHGFHRGFGYVEFDTEEAATAAVVSMNRFDLGGQLLRVTKAISPPDGISTNPVVGHLPAATAVAAASVTAKLLSMEVEQIPEAWPLAEAPTAPSRSSRHRSRSKSPRSRARPSRRRHSGHPRRRRRSSTSASASRRRKSISSSKSASSSSSSVHSSISPRHQRYRRQKNSHESRSRRRRKGSSHAEKLKREMSSSALSANSSRTGVTPTKQDGGDTRSLNGPLVVEKSGVAVTTSNSKWCSVSLEEEEAAAFVRSNDSRLYNIPSPSSIPLPPSSS